MRVAVLWPRARLGSLRLDWLVEGALLGFVLLGSLYPIAREAFPAAAHFLCGLSQPPGIALVQDALIGKLACAAALALALPWLARLRAGSWVALTRVSVLKAALVIAAVATATLTAYDLCTGFHAAERTSQGCACWLTALIAGLAALLAALAILGGRAFLRFLREAVTEIIGAILQVRPAGSAPFSHRPREARAHLRAAVLAYCCAGRGPPGRIALSPAA